MNGNPQESKEFEYFEQFTRSTEFNRLTKGENAVFPEFDINSADDLHKMRDYIYEQVPAVQRKLEFKNYCSPRLSQMQIGQALNAREDYRRYVKEHPVKVDCRPGLVTMNPHKPLPRAKGRIYC